MSPFSPERVLALIDQFARERGYKPLRVLLVGGLALKFYGMEDRATLDVDAEVKAGLEELFLFLKERRIPADLSENFSGWSIVAMAPGYAERSTIAQQTPFLEVRILAPADFVLAKLRRFTETDIEDALFVARKFNVTSDAIRKTAESAIQNSVKDTAIFLFRKNLDIFLQKMGSEADR